MSTPNDGGYIKASIALVPEAVTYPATSAGLQAQIDLLDSKVGGTIQLEATTYTLTAPVVINKPNVSLKGVDEKATRIVFAYDGIAFDFQALAVSCEMSDMTITGPPHSTATASWAINLQSGCSVHITDLTIHGCKRAINNTAISKDTLVDFVTYMPSGSATCGAFLVSDRKDVAATEAGIHVSNCTISGCNDSAVQVPNSSHTQIGNCSFAAQAAATSCITFGAATGFMDQLLIVNCEFSATAAVQNAIRGVISGTQTVDDVQIIGCTSNITLAANAFFFDFADKAAKLQVSSCSFNGTTTFNIELANVAGAVVSGCSNRGSGGGSNGLIRVNSCNNAQIVGCRAQNEGERVISVLDSNDVVVSGCLITRGTGAASMALEITGTSARCSVTANNLQCIATISSAIAAGGAGGHSITGNTVNCTGNGAGIQILSPNCVVSGNKVSVVANLGIVTTFAQTAITGNHCNGTAIVLSIGAGATNCTVCSNILDTTAANAATIDATGSATSFGNCIKGAWIGTPANIVGGPNLAVLTGDKVY